MLIIVRSLVEFRINRTMLSLRCFSTIPSAPHDFPISCIPFASEQKKIQKYSRTIFAWLGETLRLRSSSITIRGFTISGHEKGTGRSEERCRETRKPPIGAWSRRNPRQRTRPFGFERSRSFFSSSFLLSDFFGNLILDFDSQ